MRKLLTVLGISVALTFASATAANAGPRVNTSNGALIHQHSCIKGVHDGYPFTGWLRDNATIPGIRLEYVDMGHATNGTWNMNRLFSCTK